MTRVVNIAQSGGNNVTMRNRIINGGMMIDQRNAGAQVSVSSGTPQYPVDRFDSGKGGSVNTFTLQQSTTAPTGFSNSVLITMGTGISVGSTDYAYFRHSVEGYNFSDFNWGATAAAAGKTALPVTLSFWARSSITGTFGVTLRNSAADATYCATYTINSANTWEYKTVTVAGYASGTWVTGNGIGVSVIWDLGVGATYSGTANQWNTGANYFGVTGTTKLAANTGATLYITGVQLEAGTTATPFEQRLYGTELALCQRYAVQFTGGGSGNLYIGFGVGQVSSSTVAYAYIPLPATLRSAPTATYSGALTINSGGTDYPITSLSTLYGYGSGVWLTTVASGGGMTAGRGVIFYTGLASSNWILFSAEL